MAVSRHSRQLVLVNLGIVVVGLLVAFASQQFRHDDDGVSRLQASSESTASFTWDTKNVFGLGIGALIGMLTGPGGGGGATFLYPLFSSYLGISVRETAEVVSFVMFMGAISSFGLALFQMHPTNPNRALIDYASVLVLSPPMLFGVKVGAIANSVLPIWALDAATILVFGWTLGKTMLPYFRLRAKEKAREAEAAELTKEAEALDADSSDEGSSAYKPAQPGTAASAGEPEREPLLSPLLSPKRRASDELSHASSVAERDALAVRLLMRSASSFAERERLQHFRQLSEEVRAAEAEVGDSVYPLGEDTPSARTLDAFEEAEHEGQQHDDSAYNLREAGQAAPPRRGAKRAALRERAAKLWAVQPLLLQALVLLLVAAHAGFTVLIKVGAKPCSRFYWGLLGGYGLFAAFITLSAGEVVSHVNRKQQQAAAAAKAAAIPASGSTVDPEAVSSRSLERSPTFAGPNWEAIQWTGKKLALAPAPLFIVGIVAGCLGLGGGFMVTPLLLSMGLHPQCQAGTSKAFLFISTFASSLTYMVQGSLPLQYGLIYGWINLVFAPIGILAFDWIIKKTGRPSLLVLLTMARYLAGPLLLLGLTAIPDWIKTARGELPVGLDTHALCG